MSEKTEAQGYVCSVVESRICFNFKRRFLKFDGEKFYRDCCSTLKGVDFLVVDGKKLVFVEVKNFRGDERDNVWKTFPTTRKNRKRRKRKVFPIPKTRSILRLPQRCATRGRLFAGRGLSTKNATGRFRKNFALYFKAQTKPWSRRRQLIRVLSSFYS